MSSTKSPKIGTKLICASRKTKAPTSTEAPKIDPKPTIRPLRKENHMNFQGCLKTRRNSRSFNLRTSLVRLLISFASCFSAVIFAGMILSLYNCYMKISTKTGDGGETSLFGGRRVPKSNGLIEIVGELDELQSFVGLAMCTCDEAVLRRVQDDIYRLMSYFGFEMKWPKGIKAVDAEDVGFLEGEIEAREVEMSEFVRPGGSEAAARLHVCRTVCRRVERKVVEVECEGEVLKYLNRLSDLLFVMAVSA